MPKKLFVLFAIICCMHVDAGEVLKGPETDVTVLKKKYAYLLKTDNPQKEMLRAMQTKASIANGIMGGFRNMGDKVPVEEQQRIINIGQEQVDKLLNEHEEIASLYNNWVEEKSGSSKKLFG